MRLPLPALALALAVPAAALTAPETSWDLALGHRTDQLHWDIAGNAQGSNPNVLSELTWEDLQIVQLKGRVASVLEERAYLRFSGDIGAITSGRNRDSDYSGDNRTGEYSRSDNQAGDGRVWDLSFGAGRQFRPGSGKFRVAPLFGYSWHAQDLRITDGSQTIPATGAFGGLDSRYEAVWRGPWVGVDLSGEATARWSWTGSLEYHWADYSGWGNWNLRADFAHPVSFKHDARGSGTVFSLGARQAMDDGWSFDVSMDYQYWTTKAGNDRTHFSDGRFSDTQFNGATWQSFALSLGFAYRW